MIRLTCALVCVLCSFTVHADADILCLKDGRILKGPPMQKVEDGVKISFENGEVFVPDDLILETIIAGGSTFVPETDDEKKKAEKGLVPFQGRWMSPAKRDREIEKYLKKRHKKIADEEAHRLWRNRRTDKTKHFDFEYTVPQHIFEHYRDLMEAYFTAFSKAWKIRQPKSLGRLKICFYLDLESFTQIGGARGAAGYFRFVEPMELNFYYDRIDPEFTEDVMFHETNHYLTKLIDLDFNYPHFPGESLAEFYGASEYDSKTKKVTSGLIQEGRLTQIKTDIATGNMMSLEKIVKTERMYEHYSWGWSLVHFLMDHPTYEKRFKKFVIGLARSKEVKRTHRGNLKQVAGEEILRFFKKTLGLTKIEDFLALEEEWHDYVTEKLKLITPRGKEKAASAAMSSYPTRPIRAKRLYNEAIDEGSTNPLTFHKYAELLYDDSKYMEAVAIWDRAIELDPLNAQFYAKKGRALLKLGDKEESARLTKLAIDIDPEYAWNLESQLEEALEALVGDE